MLEVCYALALPSVYGLEEGSFDDGRACASGAFAAASSRSTLDNGCGVRMVKAN